MYNGEIFLEKNPYKKEVRKMKKIIVLMMLSVLILAQPAFAGVAILSEAEMDSINAGEWEIINPDNKKVVDVYYSSNDLDLKNQSQTLLKAVNNTNTVDSAVATQTNAAMTCGEGPTDNIEVGQHNNAEILNHNPSESRSRYSNCSSTNMRASCSSSSESSSGFSAGGFSRSSERSCSTNMDYDETLDAFALGIAHAEGEGGCLLGDFEACAAAVAVVDYDKTIDYNSRSRASSEACGMYASACSRESSRESGELCIRSRERSSGRSYRKNLSENNQLTLKNVSQNSLMAVSNLNAVGSGAAMQTNIAYNVGVGGTFKQTNDAIVVSGL